MELILKKSSSKRDFSCRSLSFRLFSHPFTKEKAFLEEEREKLLDSVYPRKIMKQLWKVASKSNRTNNPLTRKTG